MLLPLLFLIIFPIIVIISIDRVTKCKPVYSIKAGYCVAVQAGPAPASSTSSTINMPYPMAALWAPASAGQAFLMHSHPLRRAGRIHRRVYRRWQQYQPICPATRDMRCKDDCGPETN